MFAITPIYALPVAVIYLVLWMRVSAIRGEKGISFGDAGNAQLLQRIRQHGNCSEWFSFIVPLMMLAEGSGAPVGALHAAGGLLVLGRIAHPFGLQPDTAAHPLRYVGNGSNMLAAVILMGSLVWKLAGL